MLHIGADKMIRKRDLLMLIDLQRPLSVQTQAFLQDVRQKGHAVDCAHAKSVAIVTYDGVVFAYYSPISAVTLFKRGGMPCSLLEQER